MRARAPVRRAIRRYNPSRLAAALAAAVGASMVVASGALADTVALACAGPGGGASGLVAAIDHANATPGPDTIDLSPGCTYALTDAASPGNGLPVVTGQLTVRGHDATIKRSSPSSFRIFEVAPGAELALDEVTVAAGAVSLSGPTAFGGGILNGGLLNVTRSTIRDNEVSGSGSSAGGGGIANNGTVSLKDTVLRNNRASATGTQIFAAVGGAVLNRTGATMSIDGSTVVGNTAVSRGASELFFIASAGGIANSGTLTVGDTRIAGNRSIAVGAHGQANGGGLSVAEGTVTVAGGTIKGNSASASGDGAAAHGGGVESFGRTKLSGTTVEDNLVSGPTAQGGGIFNGRRLTIVRGTVNENVAAAASGPGQGGGIFSEAGRVILRDTEVFANQPNDCEPSIPGC